MVVRIAQPKPLLGNLGVLSCEVWPTYVGLCEETAPPMRGQWFLREPANHIDYKRGQITWVTKKVNGRNEITGSARVYIPKGEYTHILFATAADGHIIDCKRMEHPRHTDGASWVDVEPIRKSTVLPRGMA